MISWMIAGFRFEGSRVIFEKRRPAIKKDQVKKPNVAQKKKSTEVAYKRREEAAIADNPGKATSARSTGYGEAVSERSDTDTDTWMGQE